MGKLEKALKNPMKIVSWVISKTTVGRILSDKTYIKIKYKAMIGCNISFSNPQTFNEKLQWLKLYDRKPEYTTMVDKYAVKQYVEDLIGKAYIIPTLGVWNHFDEIDFEKLPNQFVLKCTHDSGGLIICKEKSQLDKKTAKEKIEKSLKRNFYWSSREWPYKDVTPRIIAEQYLQDDSDSKFQFGEDAKSGLTDYKFYCFDGQAKIVMIASNRFTEEQTTFDYFDRQYNHLPFRWGNPSSKVPPQKPHKLEEMFSIADHLSSNIPEVRVDLYLSGNHIFFGELTFFDGGGFDKIEPTEWDYKLGKLLSLPRKI